ncbi:MAG: CHAT domain-containing protein [Lewinellaceae bacterium]|nr:CHAT domain-containing protein [Lewinellaceae bacterium]
MTEAIGISEKVSGKATKEYASLLNLRGILYFDMGMYGKAEPWYLASKDILEKVLGRDNKNFAWSLENLGNLNSQMGNYEKADRLHVEAKVIWEKLLGKEDLDYARILKNRAIQYWFTGQYEKSEMMFLEAEPIWEQVKDFDSDYAMCLTTLAMLYNDMGQCEKAIPLLLEAKGNLEKLMGKEGSGYSLVLENLAVSYRNMGQYEKVEPLYLEAKGIQESVYGMEHPYYASILNNLAILYEDMGQFEKAEPLYQKAKSIWEKAQGKDHRDYAASLLNLANLYATTSQYEKAEPLYLELSNVNKSLLEKSSAFLSERELNNYLNTFSQSQDQTLSFTQIADSKKLIPACYDNSLFYKGFLLQAAGRIKQTAVKDEGAAENYSLLQGCQRRLAAQYSQPFAERDSALVAQLETQTNELEKDLVRTVAGYGEAKRQVTWQEAQASLQAEEAAVEFVHYRIYDKKATDSTMYAALVLRPGNADPVFIPLFEERSLDSLLSPFGERNGDYVNRLYSMAERGITPVEQPQKSLYELIWQPLENELAGIRTVYFSPSGLLHRLNLEAIPVSDEETLADHYQMICMNSTRQLVIPVNVTIAGQSAILFGGIQYEMDSTAIAAANQDYGADLLATRGGLPFNYTDSTLRGGAWSYLKWTEREVDKIATMLTSAGIKTSSRKGYQATEESFKAIGQTGPSPRILHLATHGYFFADPQKKDKALRMPDNELVFKISEHPLIRSGLLLAGGNYAWQTGKPIQPDMEDGILTAFEISQMNLSNTELVVLSACETGLGDIQGNEGVYGLQRAFKIAGVKYLIMSLWQVPDQETSVFMTTFYSHWISDKRSIPEAFRKTQQEMRERFINPYQWAGFVLLE